MKKKLLKSTVFGILTFLSITTHAQWEQTSMTNVKCITTLGTNIFAGGHTGLHFSPDNGVTWEKRANMKVTALQSVGNKIILGSDSGIFMSENLGNGWFEITPKSMGYNSDVTSIVSNGTDLFAASMKGIFKSPLNNITTSSWTLFVTGLPTTMFRSMAINGTKIMAGTYGQGVWISNISAADWTSTTGMISDADYVQTLAVRGSEVYAGNISGTPVLYRSTDKGLTWTPLSNGSNKPVYALITSGNNLYAGSEIEGAFLSKDKGENWTQHIAGFNCTHINIRSFAFMGNTIFAATECGVWKSAEDVVGVGKTSSSNMEILVYPNPGRGLFSIRTESEISTIEIVNTIGEIIYTKQLNPGESELDLSRFPKGIYFYRFKDEEVILKTGKIITE